MKEAIEILYKCANCCTEERKINIRSRDRNEDVVRWMDYAVESIKKDHANRSPFCTSGTMEYLKVPVGTENHSYIGEPVPREVN